ncbi:hypothetical protein [Streptomyces rhizosphaericola]|uniref:hypothetical protein n=1 Tax=Streptomyces rhizosphaericola TaxID=2564098 RepID=UPI003BF4A14F
MTRRTTEQQRARELQRTAREQGTDLGYHEALNWVREATETQARFPGKIAVPVPHDQCVMIFEPGTDPADIRRATTPLSETEYELRHELIQRRNALMDDHSKAEIIAMLLRRWRFPGQNLTRWTKQELAGELVYGEDGRERYEAYGRVGLHNGKPMPGSRPLCGGADCSGHDTATPWPETRARFRTQGPCIAAQ